MKNIIKASAAVTIWIALVLALVSPAGAHHATVDGDELCIDDATYVDVGVAYPNESWSRGAGQMNLLLSTGNGFLLGPGQSDSIQIGPITEPFTLTATASFANGVQWRLDPSLTFYPLEGCQPDEETTTTTEPLVETSPPDEPTTVPPEPSVPVASETESTTTVVAEESTTTTIIDEPTTIPPPPQPSQPVWELPATL